MKTVNRAWLKRQIDAGRVEAKCSHHLTDDYAFDNANNFGKTDWMPARIRRPVFGTYINHLGFELDRCIDSDFVQGQMNFTEHDFVGKSGGAYYQPDGTIHFYVHSNASYELRIKQVDA